MAPPTAPLNLDVGAVSGICGSISIACWVVVFSPQILENFRRRSADGLSVQFIIVWLLGDMFNILGALLQGVLPTMVILAVYYTVADLVLLGQCFHYRGVTWRDEVAQVPKKTTKRSVETLTDDTTGLLRAGNGQRLGAAPITTAHSERRGSDWSNLSHLSPAVPLVSPAPAPASDRPRATSWLQSIALHSLAIFLVCAAGVAGWYLSCGYMQDNPSSTTPSDADRMLVLDPWGQVFGWLCAVLYLGSRVPQLLLNWRRKSTEGVSMLFFLFACLGNLTYDLSIFAFEPRCVETCAPGEAGTIYGKYILVNCAILVVSWLAGSAGTLLLDLVVFVQFFMYSKRRGDDTGEEESDAVTIDEGERNIGTERCETRPLLQGNRSTEG